METEKPQDEVTDTKPDSEPTESDTQGHSLLLDTDYYIQRKSRNADVVRHDRDRRDLKETRGHKPERR